MAGIDIGGILQSLTGGGAGKPPEPQAEPLTWQDIQESLPKGATVYEVTKIVNGTPHTSKAIPVGTQPGPGDAIEVVMPDGSHVLRHVTADGSDLDDPVIVKAAPKPAADKNPDVRNIGDTKNPNYVQYNPDTKKWEPAPGLPHGEASAPQPEMHNFGSALHPNWALGIKDPTTGNWSPAGAAGGGGTHLPSGVDQSNQYVQMAYQAAQAAGIDPNLFVAQINQESGFNPSAKSPAGALGIAQIMPGTASGWGVDPSDPQAALTAAAQHMAGYLKAYGGDWSRALAAYNAGPGVADQGPSAYPLETQNYIKTIMGAAGGGGGIGGLGLPGATPKSLQHVTIGGKVYTFDPTTGKYTDSGLPGTPNVHTVAPGDTVVDQNGNVLFKAPPASSTDPTKNSLLALQMQYDSIGYVQQQLAAGQMNPTEANDYLGAVKQQTAAALAGTTPYDIYKDNLTNRYQQAQVGKDILNNQMTQGADLAKTMLGETFGKDYGLAGNGSTGGVNAFDLARAAMGAVEDNPANAGITSTAKALIDALNPNNPQLTIGGATSAALGQPATSPADAQQQPDTSLPTPPPGTGPADNTLREAA